jgi:hypothetical protein
MRIKLFLALSLALGAALAIAADPDGPSTAQPLSLASASFCIGAPRLAFLRPSAIHPSFITSMESAMPRSAAKAALALFLLSAAYQSATASTDWLQGPNGNLAIVTAAANQWYPAAIPDDPLRILAWYDQRGGGIRHLRSARSRERRGRSGMGFQEWRLHRRGRWQSPSICTDGAGGAYVIWTTTPTLTPTRSTC